MTNISIREIWPSDWVDTEPPAGDNQVCGLSAIIDGKLSAYGGIRLVGTKHFAFFNVFNGASAPVRFHRLVKAGLDTAVRNGLFPIYSACQEADFRMARRWHRLIGFREVTDVEKDDELRRLEAFLKMPLFVYGYTQ